MSYIYIPEPKRKEIAERFNKLRNDIDELIQTAYEDLASLLVCFSMFQDKMITRTESKEEDEQR